MTYDLRRLRLHGLIRRVPHTNTYVLTTEGIRTAVFYTKVHDRVLRPLVSAANAPPASPELRRALATIDHAVADTSPTPALGLQHETCHNVESSRAQVELVAGVHDHRATIGFTNPTKPLVAASCIRTA